MAITERARRGSIRVEVTAKQKEERAQAKKEALQRVEQAIKQRDEAQAFSRPLKRFGRQLCVVLHWHTHTKKRRPVTRRKLVIMADDITLDKLHDWVEGCLGLKVDESKQMVLQYEDKFGTGVRITRQTLKAWLDNMWDVQPPHLHVFPVAKLISDAEDKEERLRDVFCTFDTNQNDEMSLAEAQAMLQQLGLSEDLDVSAYDIMAYAEAQFAKADTDNDGSIGFDEFVVWYNSLASFIKGRCAVPRLSPSPCPSTPTSCRTHQTHARPLAARRAQSQDDEERAGHSEGEFLRGALRLCPDPQEGGVAAGRQGAARLRHRGVLLQGVPRRRRRGRPEGQGRVPHAPRVQGRPLRR